MDCNDENVNAQAGNTFQKQEPMSMEAKWRCLACGLTLAKEYPHFRERSER